MLVRPVMRPVKLETFLSAYEDKVSCAHASGWTTPYPHGCMALQFSLAPLSMSAVHIPGELFASRTDVQHTSERNTAGLRSRRLEIRFYSRILEIVLCL
jgi:hypothetical protein